ncbi:MAG TPA: hypothetical protein VNU26_08340 [Mycobacteriales bacterium]|nr:hypothetical protein [Mycobacteriales bacterium]
MPTVASPTSSVPALPAWVSGCDAAALRRVAGAGACTRGTQYARSGKVLHVSVRPDDALVGEVLGSGRRRYSVVVRPVPARGARPAGWSGLCSCPVQVDCKHSVATVLAARRLAPAPSAPSAAPAPPAEPAPSAVPAPSAWERRLAAFVAEDVPGAGTPLGLQVEVVVWGGQRRLSLRPVRAGASGRWVRTGASWRDLQHPYGSVVPVHRQAALALHSAWRVRQPSWYSAADALLPLDAVGPSALPLLAEAAAAGVALLDAAGRPCTWPTSRPACTST